MTLPTACIHHSSAPKYHGRPGPGAGPCRTQPCAPRTGRRVGVVQAAAVEAPAATQQQPTAPTILHYKKPSASQEFATNLKLAFALPWRRFKQDAVLTVNIAGNVAELQQSRFSKTVSMPALCEALRKAAYDPRIKGVFIRLETVNAGWAKAQEIRRYIEFFKQSGKFSMAYMSRGAEKDYFIATACDEIYVPPTASLSLRGLAVSGTFLKGVLDKVGVDPQIKRIGKFKSAGDQLLRSDMAEPQREQLTALLDDIYEAFVDGIAKGRGKSREDVMAMLDKGIYDMKELKAGGWVTDLKYSDEVNEDLKQRTGGKPDEVAAVPLSRYQNVRPSTFGLTGRKRIAIVRAQGAIVAGSSATGGQITAEPLIKQLRELSKDKSISGIVLRVDSPGGDALASDLMWREIQMLNKKKPIVASMGDVAASGGYYMAMAAPTIVAHPLTITGSIGVVTGKFNLEKAYDRVGYNKEIISRGQYAELLADNRAFSDEEKKLFDEAAEFAYRSFRDKAASSRGMEPEEIEEFAQGRVWSGTRAIANKLVDHLGAIDTAIALCKQACKIPDYEEVTLVEVSRANPSLTELVASGGLSLDMRSVAILLLTDPAFVWSTLGLTFAPALLQGLFGLAASQASALDGLPKCMLPSEFQQLSNGGLFSDALQAGLFPQAIMPEFEVLTSTEVRAGAADVIDAVVSQLDARR